MSSITVLAAFAAAYGSYHEQQRRFRELNARVPDAVSQSPLQLFGGMHDLSIECTYCGRRRSRVAVNNSCKGCGAQEVVRR
jgi:hypothetical protein